MPARYPRPEPEPPEQAAALLNQQIWCWGRDIVRPEGNWLLEVGFQRIAPPPNRTDCPSIYRLRLAGGRCVLLRGFGVFYAEPSHGGVFLPRYAFQPRYLRQPDDGFTPWTLADVPDPEECPDHPWPETRTELIRDLFGWIHEYERHIQNQLGPDYRQQTLRRWDKGKRPVVSADQMAPAWKNLSLQFAPQAHPPRTTLRA